MKILSACFYYSVLFASTALSLGLADPAHAGDCNLATLKGNYLYAQDGINISATGGPGQPFAQAGLEIFDGKGRMSGMSSANFNGTIVRSTYTGTYTLNANCSGSITFVDDRQQSSNYDIYVGEDGSEFVFVQSDANSITAAYERRRVSR